MRQWILIATLLAVAAGAAAQDDPMQKLQPNLQEQLRAVAGGDRLPVYFVIKERLGYDHWFPRVLRMSIDERRAVVMAEAQAFAEKTQRGLLAFLRERSEAGFVSSIRSNWAGNFVACEASASVILGAAARSDVAEVWYDHQPPLAEVEDIGPLPVFPALAAAAAAAAPAPPPPAALARTPGNGPLATGADKVWAFGFTGKGVIVMNSDGGIDQSHNDLKSRLWVNAKEIPNNNIDDDNNGYVDDINGWDFYSNDNNPYDGGGHGTNTAGCMVADGTCSGVTYGQAPDAQVMTGRISSETNQFAAIQYAIANGAHTQTSSYSYKHYSTSWPNYKLHRSLAEVSLAAGLIRTNSTSNNGSYCTRTYSYSRPFNISAPGCVPSPYLDPAQTLRGGKGGVLGVGAWAVTTNKLYSYSPCGPFAWYLPDVLARTPKYPAAKWDTVKDNDYPWQNGSMQGLLKPDILSPTLTITTDSGPCSTITFSGTSNATPNAMGVILLWKSANMSITPEDVAMIMHQSADDDGTVKGKENTYGAGRINALTGVKMALVVHRVNGDPGWSVTHKSGTPITLSVDGSPSKPAVIAIGFKREVVDIGGLFNIGIGSTLVPALVGATDANGDASVTLGVPTVSVGLTVYTQALIDDRAGPTGEILTGNVVGVTVTP